MRGEPLNQYFLLEEVPFKEISPAIANMYLAEDRILCYELVAKRRRNYTLHYVNDAVAETDIPNNLVDLIKQRRRWLNGTFFALVYVLLGFPRLLRRSDHSCCRRMVLTLQFMFNLGNVIIAWLNVGSLFLSLFLIYSLAFKQVGEESGKAIMWAFSGSFMVIIMALLLLAMGNKPHEVARVYSTTSIGLGVIMYFSIVLSAWHLSEGKLDIIVLFGAAATFGVYFLATALHWRLNVAMSSIAQYMFMVPTFITTFAIYSFANLQDISWGTREGSLRRQVLETGKENAAAQSKKIFEGKGAEVISEDDEDEEDDAARMALANAFNYPVMGGGMPHPMYPGAPPPIGIPPAMPGVPAMAGGGMMVTPMMGGWTPGLDASAVNPFLGPKAGSDEGEEEEEEGEDDDALAQAEAIVAEAARRAEEARVAQDKQRKVDLLERETEDLRMRFIGFRTRTMILWIAMNWMYISAILNWNKVIEFAFMMAFIMFFSLSYRFIGSVWYMVEKYFKILWKKSCGRCCCCKMPWERFKVYDETEERVNKRRGHDIGFGDEDMDASFMSEDSEARREEKLWGVPEFEDVEEDIIVDPDVAKEAFAAVFSKEATGEGEMADLAKELREAEEVTRDAMRRIHAIGGNAKRRDDDDDDDDNIDISEAIARGDRATAKLLGRIDALDGDGVTAVPVPAKKLVKEAAPPSMDSKQLPDRQSTAWVSSHHQPPQDASGSDHAEEEDDEVDLGAILAEANRVTDSALAKLGALEDASHYRRHNTGGSTGSSSGVGNDYTSLSSRPVTVDGAGGIRITSEWTVRRKPRSQGEIDSSSSHEQILLPSTPSHQRMQGGADPLREALAGAIQVDDDDDDDDDDDMMDISAILRDATEAASSVIGHVDELTRARKKTNSSAGSLSRLSREGSRTHSQGPAKSPKSAVHEAFDAV
jgi:hypothetical protein